MNERSDDHNKVYAKRPERVNPVTDTETETDSRCAWYRYFGQKNKRFYPAPIRGSIKSKNKSR